MSQERSAEWLRGAAYAIERLYFDWPAKSALIAHYASELAEAEAREAIQGSKEKMALFRIYEIASRQLAEPAGAGDAVAMAKICTEVEAVHLPSEASMPTAATGTGTLTLSETIAGLREACAGVVVSKHDEITAAEVIAAAERERDEARAHAADLRGALEEAPDAIDHPMTGDAASMMRQYIRPFITRTPPQSLGWLKAEALLHEYRKLAKRFREADHKGRPATLSVTWAVLAESMDLEADRLEKEATNG